MQNRGYITVDILFDNICRDEFEIGNKIEDKIENTWDLGDRLIPRKS